MDKPKAVHHIEDAVRQRRMWRRIMARATRKKRDTADDLRSENAALRAATERKDQVAETEYLLASRANREALLASIAQLDAGMGVIEGPDESDAA